MHSCYLKYFTGVLWTGNFVAWFGHLTRWTIDIDAFTDCKLRYFLFYFGGHYSSMLLAVMSIEKFFALYFPLKAKSYCTVGTAKWVTSIRALVIAGFNFPLLIFYRFDGTECAMTKHSGLIEIMDTVLYAIVPIVVMLLANAAIIYKLMYIKYKGISQTNQSVSKSSTRGSVMVVTISLAFIILTSPRAVDSGFKFQFSVNPFTRLFIISMQYLNNAINGILYCIFGEKFRNELLKIISCCRKENSGQTRSNSMNPDNTNTITASPV